MNNTVPLIKICGIQDAITAKQAAIAGADFIGMVFYPGSKRHVDLETAKKIAEATLQAGAVPVAVVVDSTLDTIVEICTVTKINTVQLHGDNVRKLHKYFPVEIQKIYVCPVDKEGNTIEDTANALQYLDPTHDFLLFDNLQAGSGKPFNWEKFQYTGNFQWFLSGGLSSENVGIATTKLNPNGVDVSSGVENLSGIKDIALIKNFITKVKLNYE